MDWRDFTRDRSISILLVDSSLAGYENVLIGAALA